MARLIKQEKKLKTRGLTDAEIKRLKKQDDDGKGRFGANVKKKRTFFRDDKPYLHLNLNPHQEL